MKTVLVTGAAGFIGKNLCAVLENDDDIEVLKSVRGDDLETLTEHINRAEFVFHLAGVNRPERKEEFRTGNWRLTKDLVEIISKSGKKIPVAMTSSIQAGLDNDYGKSKRASEEELFKWSENSKNSVYIYRLPNVFGKWSRPNYNSVVATFCHNIANGLPILINKPSTELTLVYIDDVVSELISAMNGSANMGNDGFCYVRREFTTTLQSLADTIYSFLDCRNKLVIPNFEGDFVRFLFATFSSFYNREKFGYKLLMRRDDRGWLAEFIKSKHVGQIFISRTRPGIIRGNHWHNTKVEKFLVLDGIAEISFRSIYSNEVNKYHTSGQQLEVIDVPAGYTHSIKNTGSTDLITLFWANEIFDPENSDTFFQEVEAKQRAD